ncbi:hypothetical protein PMIN06_012678 [Paraphaeosphaeria minitans]
MEPDEEKDIDHEGLVGSNNINVEVYGAAWVPCEAPLRIKSVFARDPWGSAKRLDVEGTLRSR